MSRTVVDISKILGSGYRKLFKDTTHRYNVIKGGRGSGKSKSTALYIIYTLLKHPTFNALCVRQNYNTLFDSCFSDLKWACERLKVTHLFEFKVSPLRVIRKQTNQQIIFRGMNDPLSLTSLSVPQGNINLIWCEEAYQFRREDDFDKLDFSIRGSLQEGEFFKFIVTFNPYSDRHWLYKRFFAEEHDNVLAWTTTYKQNPFVGEDFVNLMEDMKKTNPKKYRVLGDGHWGIAEGLIYDNWRVEDIDLSKVPNKNDLIISSAIDFGYNHPTAFLQIAVDLELKKIYVVKELYNRFQTADDIAEMLIREGLRNELIWGDSARPEVIEHLKRKGLNVKPTEKGKDSVLTGIQTVQDFEIIVDYSCVHTQEELSLYCWDEDKEGNKLEQPLKINDDLMDCIRYSLMPLMKPKKKSRVRAW